jgi:hypothetical protein
MTTGPAWYVRIAAGLLAVVIVLNGCAAERAIIFPEQNQSVEQIARDQTECTAEAQRSTSYTDATQKGLGTTLVGSIAGAIAGAVVGALVGLFVAPSGSPNDAGTAGLILAGSVAAGAVVGWFVGTGLGVRASARQTQDLVGQAFRQCMEKRGYKVGRERR